MQGFQRFYLWYGSGPFRHFIEFIWRPLMKASVIRSSALFFFLCLLVGAFLSTRFLDDKSSTRENPQKVTKVPLKKKLEFPLDCKAFNRTNTCPRNYPTSNDPEDEDRRPSCPDYYRWIYEDLLPWMETGITRDMVESARRTANFRLVIKDGKAYVEQFQKAFQTRDIFTLWGILQLLRRYPGKVPDLELMFDCVDWPVIIKNFYREQGPNSTAPPPLFRYCKDDATLDIPFPDWSFWGWPEINIKPWESLLNDLKKGNEKTKWMDREPYAYWKGNPTVAETRQDLMKCNVSDKQDWNVRVYAQDWIKESKQGYKQSDLANQCRHRYKIYIEGSAWSVSEKYILACDSVTLIVKPRYYDFFTRSLMPVKHYWPVKEDDKCRSLKYAVDWGNNHKQKAHMIGKTSSEFILSDLKMDYVYDYMFHLLGEYAKLLRFKPTIPKNATELCSESMACSAQGLENKFMKESMVKGPAERSPCAMPPPYDAQSLYALQRLKVNSIRQVESWEKQYWKTQNSQ